MTEERDPEDKSVVLGVGDRKGLKDKIRDIYRRGRTKKGQEVRIIPPPEMELTNEIIVNSKEVDDERDASQSTEESDIELVSGENRSHRLLDMKLFERLKKHPVIGERPTTKEEEDEGNSLLTTLDEESHGLVDGTSTVNGAIMPGADQESVTETTSGSVRNYYPTTQRTNTEAVGSDLTLSADVLEDDLETTTNPPPSAPVPTEPAKPTLRITQKNKINVTPIAEPEPTTEPEPEPQTTDGSDTFPDHEFIKDPVQVLDSNSDKSEALKLVPKQEPDNIEPEPETESPNPEPESEPEPEVEPESTTEPEPQPEPVTTDFPRIKIKTASTTPHTTPLPPAPEEPSRPPPMTPADARVGFLDFVSTVDNTVMHFTLSSPEKDESQLLTSYPVAPTRPPRPVRPTPPPLAPVEKVTPTPAVISSSPPAGASTYYPTRIEPTSVTPPDDSSSKISGKVTNEVETDVKATTTPLDNIGGNVLATDGQAQQKVDGDATTLIPEQESTTTTTTTTTTLKPTSELSFQEKLRRRFQKFRQSTVSRIPSKLMSFTLLGSVFLLLVISRLTSMIYNG